MPDEIPEINFGKIGDAINILQLLVDTKLVSSKGDARRLVEQGGISINNKKVDDMKNILYFSEPIILKVGKRKFLKVVPH